MHKIQDRDNNKALFCDNKRNDIYIINTIELDESNIACLFAIDDQTNLWHRRDKHLNM